MHKSYPIVGCLVLESIHFGGLDVLLIIPAFAVEVVGSVDTRAQPQAHRRTSTCMSTCMSTGICRIRMHKMIDVACMSYYMDGYTVQQENG